jgi:hypothetical protein
MREKTITITIDQEGRATFDLEGFAGKGCERVFNDFHGGDLLKVERKKLDYYSRQQVERGIKNVPNRKYLLPSGIAKRLAVRFLQSR